MLSLVRNNHNGERGLHVAYHAMGNLVGKGDKIDRLHFSQFSIGTVRSWHHCLSQGLWVICIICFWVLRCGNLQQGTEGESKIQ